MKYIFLFTALLLVSCFGKAPEKTGMEGKTLPEFSFLLPDSTTWLSTKDIKPGKPTIFFLFSTYCPYCKSQLSKILDDKDLLKDIQIYMITAEPFDEMKRFYNAYNLGQNPSIKMGRDTSDFFGQYMNVKNIPFLALYDKNKRLTRAFSGMTGTNLLKAILVE